MSSYDPVDDRRSTDEFPLYNPGGSQPGGPVDNPPPPGDPSLTSAYGEVAGQQGQREPHNQMQRRAVIGGSVAIAGGLVALGVVGRNGVSRSSGGALALPSGTDALLITMTTGTVTVRGTTDGDGATADWRGRGDAPAVGESDGAVTISGRNADLDVAVPEGAVLEIHTTSGDIDIDSVVADSLTLRVTTGDVSLEGSAVATAVVKSTTGDIRMSDSSPGSLAIETTTGEVELDLEGQPNEVSVETTTGDVDISLSGRGYDYRTDTKTGDVDVPDNSGQAAVTIRTTTGDIDVRER